MREEEHRKEQHGDYPCADLYFPDLSCEHLDHDIGEKSESDSVGNVIGKRHHCKGKESGNRRGNILPIDILDASHHKNADIDEGGTVRKSGNQLCKRSEEKCGHKCGGCDERGKTGLSLPLQ